MKYKVVRMWRNVDVKIERCKISIKTLDVFFLLVMVKSSKKNQTCSLRPDFADVVGIYLFFLPPPNQNLSKCVQICSSFKSVLEFERHGGVVFKSLCF